MNINSIKETILYYIVEWFSSSWLYYNVFKKMYDLKQTFIDNKDVYSYNDAKHVMNRKIYKFVPKSYKKKILNDYFS